MPPLTRREFMLAAAAGTIPLLNACANSSDTGDDDAPLDVASFTHGVASGDPWPDAVILWTRAESPGGEPARIRYELAMDTSFSDIIRSGRTLAEPDAGYTVKIDVTGLQADQVYYYRFLSASESSPIGRTRTLPDADADIARMRLAFVTCSNYVAGYFHAYRRVAERNDLQAVVHLGDYIYENGDQDRVRPHDPPYEIVSLADYRARYAQYRLDEDLQELHRQHPMIWVWDDHEVCNNAWKDGAQSHDPELGDYYERRQQAVRAAFEWLPIRPPDPADSLRVYRDFRLGRLADLTMLDTRHIGRDEQLAPNTLFGDTIPVFTQTGDFLDPARQLLGAEQEAWFEAGLAQKTATWQLIGNQVYFSQLKLIGSPEALGGGVYLSPDKWDGYKPARDRLFALLQGRSNLVFLTGDAHEAYAFEVTPDPNGPNYSPASGAGAVGVEFVATSITSRGDPDSGNGLTSVLDSLAMDAEQLLRVTNPHLKYYENTLNGYLLLDLTPERLQAEFWMVPMVSERTDGQTLDRAFSVASGVAHLMLEDEATEPLADAPMPAP
ncbi:MAG: alkaline phosphatase D family protein [Pseudomonadota bacterium]|nr:alkaline phosphatase D family protein [Pseudomonadota bacterium]